MMEILNSAQMANADKYTIEKIGIPSVVLMENAASGIAEVIKNLDVKKDKIAVFAGSGNNGGDGITLTRKCYDAGYKVDLYLTSSPEKLKGDPLLNYNILQYYPVCIFNAFEDNLPEDYDIIVDSIFGTGLSRPVEGKYKTLIKKLNELPGFKIAVDMPSGLADNTNAVLGECFRADVTVTMCRAKIPHKIYPAKKFCGKVKIVNISIPDFAVANVKPDIYEITEKNIEKLNIREPDSHKGKFGHAVIIGGSAGKTGAALMASKSCAKAGAGLTTTVIPSALNLAAEMGNPEVMSFPVGSGDYFRNNDAKEVTEFINDKTVAAIGPGMGRDDKAIEFIKQIIAATNLPLVIDADGLYGLDQNDFEKLRFRGIITPHIGEFARIVNKTNEEVINNKLELVREFSTNYGIVTVLKSADTIIGIPDGTILVLNTGTPALAKGGSGDCLTGLITSFVSQNCTLKNSAVYGAWILGKTAEHLTKKYNERTILTSDLIDNLWIEINELYRNN
ncbi:NAD(P)H-hydrate dehydratase [Flexistipes sinusarabici]|nr:NAD(P)H-hydrate dehydratase [Flexistipes sinusarabici]